jgi:hypothetical protein
MNSGDMIPIFSQKFFNRPLFTQKGILRPHGFSKDTTVQSHGYQLFIQRLP